MPVTVAGMVEAVVDLVTLTGKAKAKAFLGEQLRYSAMPATVIAERAREAGVTATALRRGKPPVVNGRAARVQDRVSRE